MTNNMLNENLRKQLENKAKERMAELAKKSPGCAFSVVVYDESSGTREGEVIIRKEKPFDEIIEIVVGNCRQN